MVRNIVIFGGSSHQQLTETICSHLGVPPAKILLSKFSVGETRVEIGESVRGKDVFIVQSGGGKINDHLMELLITVSACKTASAQRVTVILPLFPYSRQSDLPYNKVGAPLARMPYTAGQDKKYTFETMPQTPYLGSQEDSALSGVPDGLGKKLANLQTADSPTVNGNHLGDSQPKSQDFATNRRPTTESTASDKSDYSNENASVTSLEAINGRQEANEALAHSSKTPEFQPQRGYKQWVAQAGKLVADLLTCAGTDHVITMDLHDPQYQGFFDIPVDNLYGRLLLRKYIQYSIPDYQEAVIVSPDAGGAKRATAIADSFNMKFALIHKERRPTQISDRQNASMMLVGDVAERTAILIDDLADTSNTITRAAKLLKKAGATTVYALVTHGVLSGDAIERINASALDKVVVTNSVDQKDHKRRCPKLEVLEVGNVFAEAIRRVHHGESISALFQYD
ncbi:MAG: ribose-phosphate pyrophosphokinase [Bathelium mastoideum]|nr:MAG: ribose-phosphate pyrophosphokinase [Bathelium mastoideum]